MSDSDSCVLLLGTTETRKSTLISSCTGESVNVSGGTDECTKETVHPQSTVPFHRGTQTNQHPTLNVATRHTGQVHYWKANRNGNRVTGRRYNAVPYMSCCHNDPSHGGCQVFHPCCNQPQGAVGCRTVFTCCGSEGCTKHIYLIGKMLTSSIQCLLVILDVQDASPAVKGKRIHQDVEINVFIAKRSGVSLILPKDVLAESIKI